MPSGVLVRVQFRVLKSFGAAGLFSLLKAIPTADSDAQPRFTLTGLSLPWLRITPLAPHDTSITGVERPFLISGPCSAESEQQVLDTARALQHTGIHLFRAGVWKPRTRPNAFEGRGEPALDWLVTARQETGIPVATEVANTQHVEACLNAGIDVLWIGARTTVSPFAVQEIATALQGTNVPVFVKNPCTLTCRCGWAPLNGCAKQRMRRLGHTPRIQSLRSTGIPQCTDVEIAIALQMAMPELKHHMRPQPHCRQAGTPRTRCAKSHGLGHARPDDGKPLSA